ncbi:MAG: transcription termination/antitermination NusG family protein [Lachnospira eligens]
MWYIAHTTAGRELDAVDKCRKSIPEDIAARVFSPIWQHAKKYEGSWHLDNDILFAGYIFIESDSDSKTLEKLLWRIPNVGFSCPHRWGFQCPITRKKNNIFVSLWTSITILLCHMDIL